MSLYLAVPLLLMQPMNPNSIEHAVQTVRLRVHTKAGDCATAQFAG
jgi:hypothetical protein